MIDIVTSDPTGLIVYSKETIERADFLLDQVLKDPVLLAKAAEHNITGKMKDYWDNLFNKGDPVELKRYTRRVRKICKS